jgi:predicted O-methyltransferase YrrM
MFDHCCLEGYFGQMDRVTSDLIALFHEDFPKSWRWPDLLEKSKEEAERAQVDFMSLGEAEMSMVAQALQFGGATLKPSKWVEIGSLTGYSGLCILSILAPGSELWTIEKSADRCRFLREHFKDPRLAGKIHSVEGDSRTAKATLETYGLFDGVFLDGAKAEYQNDLDWAEANVKTGGLILADNVFLGGSVFDPQSVEKGNDRHSAKQVQIMHGYLTRISDPQRYQTLMIPTSDGLSVSRKLF